MQGLKVRYSLTGPPAHPCGGAPKRILAPVQQVQWQVGARGLPWTGALSKG